MAFQRRRRRVTVESDEEDAPVAAPAVCSTPHCPIVAESTEEAPAIVTATCPAPQGKPKSGSVGVSFEAVVAPATSSQASPVSLRDSGGCAAGRATSSQTSPDLLGDSVEGSEPPATSPHVSPSAPAANRRNRKRPAPDSTDGLEARPNPAHREENNPRADVAKMKQAARQFLRTHRDEDKMSERLEVVALLSSTDMQRFCAANKDRRKGEWVWDVLDGFVAERGGRASAAEDAAGNHIPDGALPVLPAVSSEGSCPSAQTENGAVGNAMSSVLPPLEAPADMDTDELNCADGRALVTKQASAQTSQPSSGTAALLPRKLAGIGSAAPASTAPLAVLPYRATTKEGRSVGPLITRRGGACSAPTVRSWAASTTMTKVSSVPSLSGSVCRHRRHSRQPDCRVVCADCGEILFYDGWTAERIAPDERASRLRELQGKFEPQYHLNDLNRA